MRKLERGIVAWSLLLTVDNEFCKFRIKWENIVTGTPRPEDRLV